MFGGVFAIFGHGNVTCLGPALEGIQDELPTWRGQNEQGMALAAVAFAKARRRRQIMVATSSVGPGAMNLVTAAAVAHANRLPLLLLPGDTFASRIPDPVLQQVEHFDNPTITANDAFRSVTRYWDRITRPEQLAQSLPQVTAALLDPADCGPALISLPQDVQGEAYPFPERLFEKRFHDFPRPRADARSLERASQVLGSAERPLIIAGGGVHYSEASDQMREFAERHEIPLVETMAGKSILEWDHPLFVGPVGVTGCAAANLIAGEADVILAVGTRLQDFTTGSWTVFRNEHLRIVSVNTARFDATKHLALAVVGDARECLIELDALLAGWRAEPDWTQRARTEAGRYRTQVEAVTAPGDQTPTYAQVVGAINRLAGSDDYVVAASGGLPGELNHNWRSKGIGTFDCEYGFSCMGYEIAGGWGASMARNRGHVIVFVGDGAYLMMNSDLYSSVLSGHPMIVIVCDNGGYGIIERLQLGTGGRSFNNMWETCRTVGASRVDFVAHARAMGCDAIGVSSTDELEAAFTRARSLARTCVIVVSVQPDAWTDGGSFWEVGIPEVSDREAIQTAREDSVAGKRFQRVGW